jgi:hypothetical protein
MIRYPREFVGVDPEDRGMIAWIGYSDCPDCIVVTGGVSEGISVDLWEIASSMEVRSLEMKSGNSKQRHHRASSRRSGKRSEHSVCKVASWDRKPDSASFTLPAMSAGQELCQLSSGLQFLEFNHESTTMKNSFALTFAILTALVLGQPVSGAIVVNVDDSVVLDAASVDGFNTFGNLMDGIMVTAFFDGGGSETIEWLATVDDSGSATGTDWSLSVDGHTHHAVSPHEPWVLSNSTGSALTMLVIDAYVGNIAFDLDDSSEITPGSEIGLTFGPNGHSGSHDISGNFVDGDVTALYSNPLTINGGSLPGTPDLYGTLKLTFFDSALPSGETVEFDADTDFITMNVPEPSTLMLLVGAAFVGLCSRRKNQGPVQQSYLKQAWMGQGSVSPFEKGETGRIGCCSPIPTLPASA